MLFGLLNKTTPTEEGVLDYTTFSYSQFSNRALPLQTVVARNNNIASFGFGASIFEPLTGAEYLDTILLRLYNNGATATEIGAISDEFLPQLTTFIVPPAQMDVGLI